MGHTGRRTQAACTSTWRMADDRTVQDTAVRLTGGKVPT
ncbi:MAG: hypothetical protein AVDCRST_MAG06-1468 [uncultured Nocardioides sp.]|uniref:Uncharacterized protein n=1 Tax=uncultured Nocardioides sp. TaxID=198441 RepID=A0A6J4NIZ7_9ACTN|nr:MAG: hypothetical protein AVDCRST_MAG06-1468 [uncultured Nocardioides sp.]